MEEKILYADDEESILNLVGNILKRVTPDYEKIPCSNGHMFREELSKGLEGIALVITDNDLPEKSFGLKMTEEYSGKGTPFIMMSGYDIRKEAMQNGAYGFIMKPFGVQDFVNLVKSALDSRK